MISRRRPALPRLPKHLVPFAALVVVSLGCERGPDVTLPTFSATTSGEPDSVFSDDQLVAAAYSNHEPPRGFYTDTGDPVYYVNNGSIVDGHHRAAPPWTQLSTEDPAVAREWALQTVAYSNAVAPVADSPPIVTERYFEFVDVPGPGLTHVRMRVDRSSYLTDVVMSPPGRGVRWAVFHAKRINAGNVRPLGEYLWTQLGPLAYSNCRVLSSFATDTPTDVAHAIYVVQRSIGDYGIPEVIGLIRLNIRVNKVSGEIRGWPTVVREIPGRQG